MTSAEPTFIHVFHGGPHDGLVLAAPVLQPIVPLPTDRVISNLREYGEWQPAEGDQLYVYELKGPPRLYGESGHYAHHLHMDRTVTVVLPDDKETPQ